MRAGDAGYWLRVRSDMAADALALLNKYIIFSKAEAKREEALVGIGLFGPDAAKLGDQLSADLGITHLLVTERPGARRECWFEARLMPAVLELVEQGASPAERNAWELLEIDAAVPELAPATAEAFIPQMLNLQALGGVSFTKGCYTGQEIVTRLQHRGQLKRPMYLAEVFCKAAPQPGDPVAVAERDEVGQVCERPPSPAVTGCWPSSPRSRPTNYRCTSAAVKAPCSNCCRCPTNSTPRCSRASGDRPDAKPGRARHRGQNARKPVYQRGYRRTDALAQAQ